MRVSLPRGRKGWIHQLDAGRRVTGAALIGGLDESFGWTNEEKEKQCTLPDLAPRRFSSSPNGGNGDGMRFVLLKPRPKKGYAECALRLIAVSRKPSMHPSSGKETNDTKRTSEVKR